ncbi:MAG: Ig-like domain-containing protein, partial [Planctomycetota bacterium]
NDLVASGAALSITSATTPTGGGSVSIVGARSIRYVPARDYSGTETFQYTIDDGRGSTSTGTVTIQVNNINQPPVAMPDGYELPEDSFNQILNVLENDSALPDTGETLSVIAVTNPSQGGTVTFDQSQIIYTPKPNFFGIETFNYTISDGNGGTATTTVTVNVLNVNDQPTAVADSYAVNPGSFFNQLNVLANDLIAPDADETLTIVSVGPTANGGLVQIDSGPALLYTPPSGPNPNTPYTGPDSFIYQISDGNGGLSSAVVTINVSVVNQPPVAGNDLFQIARNSTNNRLNILDNDTFAPDIDETLSVTQFTRPGQGELLQLIQNGTALLYSPPVNFIGTQTLTYTLSDGRGGTAVGTVTIQVGDFNSQPVAVNDFYSLGQNSIANSLNVLVNDFDPDGTDLLTIVNNGQILTASGGIVVVAPDGASLIYTAPQPFLGIDTFTYQITDNRGGQSSATVTISILGWQNPANPLDVNQDAEVTSLDAVILLNEINRLINPPLTQPSGQMPPPVLSPIYFYDVNSDGFLTAVDVLQIVNFLNRPGAGAG